MQLTHHSNTSYFFGLRITEALALVAGSVCFGIFLANVYSTDSFWTVLGLSFSFFVLGQMIVMASRRVVFPEMASLIACMMWVVAPWIAYIHYYDVKPMYQMAVPENEYMVFAVPASIALWMGMHLMLRPSDNFVNPENRDPLTPEGRRLMDGLIVFGFLMDFLSPHLPSDLKTLSYILAQLRFVATLSFLFSGSRGWILRVAIVYLALFSETASGAVFYELVLWSCYLVISLAYLNKWRWKLLLAFLAGFYLLTTLNAVKEDYRYELGSSSNLPFIEKLNILTDLFFDKSQSNLSDENIADKTIRWNQGWIIARIMATVPNVEPYANGETIQDAVIASLLPRFMFPDKLTTASQEFFTTYTRAELNEETAMELGVPGEMYANFGVVGGVIGTGIYGLLIGFIFSKFVHLAKKNTVVWAWVPFVLLVAFEAEWNVYDILNYLVKSFAVFVVVISAMPMLRKLFFGKVRTLIYRITRRRAQHEI